MAVKRGNCMKKIVLNAERKEGITVMIFAEGTILKPKSWHTLYNHNKYQPIGNAAEIIRLWSKQGANIFYCTSRKKQQVEDMAKLLGKYGFEGVYLVAREPKESYKDIVEAIKPDVLVEDDCKSIGGSWQMCIHKVDPKIRKMIKSIVVAEFGGIDHLPVDLAELLNTN